MLLVDDYDVVATGMGSPIAPLADHLTLARDVGLHVVRARRVGRAVRASFEPVVQRLGELGVPGLLLCSDPAEGPLHGGTRARPQPLGRGCSSAAAGVPCSSGPSTPSLRLTPRAQPRSPPRWGPAGGTEGIRMTR